MRTSIRRLVAAVGFAALAAVSLVTPGAASAGSADERACVLTPPARLAIFAVDRSFPASISGPCATFGWGYWHLATPSGAPTAVAYIDGTRGYGPTIFVPDLLSRYGAQAWTPDEEGAVDCTAHEPTCEDLAQNSPVTDVRLATAPWLTGSRRGSTVTLSVTSNIWSTGTDRFFARAMAGEIQVLGADGTWRRVGEPFTTYSSGKRSVSLRAPDVRTYRYAIYSLSYSWDAVSARHAY